MYLSIGGIYIEIKSNDNSFMLKIAEEFKAFAVGEGVSECFLIEVEHGFVPQEVECINVVKKEGIFEFEADEFKGSIDVEQKLVKVHIADLIGVFNCFLRVFYSIVLLENQGLLVHSVGLTAQGKGYLFAGASESGKTTAARMAKNRFNVLNDELVIIRQVNNDIFLFSTPFNGEFEERILSNRVSLQAISFLNKNIDNGLKRLTKMEMFSELMTDIFFFLKDFESNQSLIEMVNHICDRIDGYSVDLFNYDIGRVINGISENSSKQSGSLAAS